MIADDELKYGDDAYAEAYPPPKECPREIPPWPIVERPPCPIVAIPPCPINPEPKPMPPKPPMPPMPLEITCEEEINDGDDAIIDGDEMIVGDDTGTGYGCGTPYGMPTFLFCTHMKVIYEFLYRVYYAKWVCHT